MEQKCLGNVLLIFRLRLQNEVQMLERLVKQFLSVVSNKPVEKALWIVEVGRIRMHQLETQES